MIAHKEETRLRGLALSGGVSLGRVCLFNERRHSNLPVYRVQGSGLRREQRRLERAVQVVRDSLETVRRDVAQRIGPAEAEIFVAQRMILEDPALVPAMEAKLRAKRYNAESAVAEVLDFYESRLLQLDSEYIKDRASDIGEVRRRLLDALANMNPSLQCADDDALCQRGRDRIIVAEELTPSLTLLLDRRHTLGFVTERGGVNSHAAILARALGIPAVSGIPRIHSLLSCGTPVLVDGSAGEVVLWPTAATAARTRTGDRAAAAAPEQPVPGFAVQATIGRSDDLADALAAQAEGIGLYRTELECLAAGRLLSEEEQFHVYQQVLATCAGRPVTFRLFDFGGDKALPALDLPAQANPELGLQGARLLLQRPELLRGQLRAIARAAAAVGAEARVLVPMVTGAAQFREFRALAAQASADITGARVLYGAMFEIPAACLEAGPLLAAADFASLGTNDLIQYLFAVDRDNAHVAADYRADSPVLWRLIRAVARAAARRGKPLSLCGELAADPGAIARLRRTGIDTVSVPPGRVAEVRRAARESGRRPQ